MAPDPTPTPQALTLALTHRPGNVAPGVCSLCGGKSDLSSSLSPNLLSPSACIRLNPSPSHSLIPILSLSPNPDLRVNQLQLPNPDLQPNAAIPI